MCKLIKHENIYKIQLNGWNALKVYVKLDIHIMWKNFTG